MAKDEPRIQEPERERERGLSLSDMLVVKRESVWDVYRIARYVNVDC